MRVVERDSYKFYLVAEGRDVFDPLVAVKLLSLLGENLDIFYKVLIWDSV